MAATVAWLELQVTDVVILAVLPSLYNGCVLDCGSGQRAGVQGGATAIDCRGIAVTVSEVDAVGAPATTTDRRRAAFRSCRNQFSSMAAMVFEEEDQVTKLVVALGTASLRSPFAVNWMVSDYYARRTPVTHLSRSLWHF